MAFSIISSSNNLYMMTEESFDAILVGFRNQRKILLEGLLNISSRKCLSVLWRAEMQIASASTAIALSSDELREKDAGTCWYERHKRTEPISINVAPARQTYLYDITIYGKAMQTPKCKSLIHEKGWQTSLGFSRSSIFLSDPGLKTTSSKLQSCSKTTCLNVMASIFLEVVLNSISSEIDLLSFLALSLTLLAGKNC